MTPDFVYMGETKLSTYDGKPVEVRDGAYTADYQSRRNGHSTYEIQCPFCGRFQTVSIWSFAGCGKNCICGASLHRMACFRSVKAEA